MTVDEFLKEYNIRALRAESRRVVELALPYAKTTRSLIDLARCAAYHQAVVAVYPPAFVEHIDPLAALRKYFDVCEHQGVCEDPETVVDFVRSGSEWAGHLSNMASQIHGAQMRLMERGK